MVRKLVIAVTISLALTGCAGNPYSTFYKPIPESPFAFAHRLPPSKPISVSSGSGNAVNDFNTMNENGYSLIGVSSFVGPINNGTGALEQAKKVGAEIVIINQKYRNTNTGAMPIVTPTTATSFNNGSVTAYGAGGGMVNGFYNGTSTTYGSETTYIPYSIERYEHTALFFVPLTRQGLGITFKDIPTELKSSIGTNKGVFVVAVRKESPAFNADILAGDVVTKVNGKSVYDIGKFHEVVSELKNGAANITLLRHGKQITKKVSYSDAGW